MMGNSKLFFLYFIKISFRLLIFLPGINPKPFTITKSSLENSEIKDLSFFKY